MGNNFSRCSGRETGGDNQTLEDENDDEVESSAVNINKN